MKPIPLKISARSRASRFFSYLCLGVLMTIPIAILAHNAYGQYQATGKTEWPSYAIPLALLPFIFVGGEMLRFRSYCSKIPSVLCVDCRHQFDIKQLVKTGECPECRSKRVVGLVSDENDQIVTLH
jgi:DNA-directed RNA polymerase subunit RPC12/RpoP